MHGALAMGEMCLRSIWSMREYRHRADLGWQFASRGCRNERLDFPRHKAENIGEETRRLFLRWIVLGHGRVLAARLAETVTVRGKHVFGLIIPTVSLINNNRVASLALTEIYRPTLTVEPIWH